jgi:hypothetical protein
MIMATDELVWKEDMVEAEEGEEEDWEECSNEDNAENADDDADDDEGEEAPDLVDITSTKKKIGKCRLLNVILTVLSYPDFSTCLASLDSDVSSRPPHFLLGI